MISQLKKKFIIINMSLVVIIFILFFSFLLLFTQHQNKNKTVVALEQTLEINNLPPRRIELNNPRDPAMNIFTFLVSINEGKIKHDLSKNNVIISDEVMALAVEKALATNQTSGVINSLNLRFLIDENPSGISIAFADISNEISARNQLMLILAIAGGSGLIAFFFISLYLANWTLRPAEQAWRQQQQFVADASHELKTPLTVILANLSILFTKNKETIASQQKWLKNTQDEAMRMKSLVEDLLYLAKSDAAQVRLELTKLNFSELLWNCILPFESIAYESGIMIESNILPDIWVLGDEKSLKQVIVILMDNACKYTPKKGIISVSLNQNQNFALLEVTNSGDPIPEQNLTYLFNRFYRVDESRQHQQGSYGLGLSIAQSIANKHKSKITVNSDLHRGTTFKLPLEKYKGQHANNTHYLEKEHR